MRMACYHAALDWAMRGRRMIAAYPQGKEYGELTRHALFAQLLLGRFDEVEQLCADIRASSDDPALLAHATYATAILNARLYAPARRDYDAAAASVDASLTFTERLPVSSTRAVNSAFLKNTRALLEMRRKRPDAALRLLEEALQSLETTAPDAFATESAILFHNRARVYIALGDIDRAIHELTTLLTHEPSNSEACFDRGVLHQRAGRPGDALRDYDAAIAWSPPYFEPHFNRAEMLVALGRVDEAIEAYAYVLALEPSQLEAHGNRACLLFERGDLDAARTAIEEALARGVRTARLVCIAGLVQLRDGALDAAEQSFSEALQLEPTLADAWANRATVWWRRGDLEAAARDLTRALELRVDPSILTNRGCVWEALQRWEEAVTDYSRALALAPDLAPQLVRRRDRCARHGE
jgi:tetratricopeptide (TPR) repeat protein